MKLRIWAIVILLAALAAALGCGWFLNGEYARATALYEDQTQQIQALTAEAQKLQKELDALTMDNAQAQQAQAEDLARQARELEEQMQTLRTEMEEMNTYLEENQEAAALAQEELNFLQGVYDALEEGLKKVEGYIAGN